MAKTEKTEEVVTEGAEAAVEAKADGRSIKINVPATAAHPYTTESFEAALKGETKVQARAEFIREYANTGMYSRAQLTEFTRLASGLKADDKSLKYQIIFQATKTIDKSVWPAKEAATAETAEAAAAE